jgi:dolichol kinase
MAADAKQQRDVLAAGEPGSRPLTPSVRRELARKALHLATAAIPVGYALGVPRRALLPALTALAVGAVVMELGRRHHAPLRAVLHRLGDSLLRPAERDAWTGATWLFVAFLALVAAAPRDVAVAGMWAVSAGDGLAAMVGTSVARWRSVPGKRKSLPGTAACVAATALGAVWIAHLSLPESLIAAACAGAAERWAVGVDDNVCVAVAVACGICLWRLAFS